MMEELQEVELSVVESSSVSTRSLIDEGTSGKMEVVMTEFGPTSVAVYGDLSRPVILTYHDLGLNHVTNFQAFFNHPEMRPVVNLFCIVHMNALGQELGAPTLPNKMKYPTMDELAEIITTVKNHLGFRTFTGFGVGLGANVLVRYAVKHPKCVEALLLVNCCCTSAGIYEWMNQRVNLTLLQNKWMMANYLLQHHFGHPEECNQDLVTVYRENFTQNINHTNLAHLVNAYINRSNLDIGSRDIEKVKRDKPKVRCPVLNMTSSLSVHISDVEISTHASLLPSPST